MPATASDESSQSTATTATSLSTTATSATSNNTKPQNDNWKQEQHVKLLNTLYQITLKIQKEARGRRFKEEQKPMEEVLETLIKMKDIKWPPMAKEDVPIPEWMDEKSNSEKSSENEGQDHSKSSEKKKETKKETTHAWVLSMLQTYSILLQHPYKTSTITELTLDCVLILISNGYVAGSSNFFPKLIDSIVKCSESSSDAIQVSMCKCLLALFTSSSCEIHEASMLTAVRATFHVYLVSKSPGTKQVAKSTLLDMLKAVLNRMEAYDAASNGHDSQYHTDAYLLFRALCKLSAKSLPGDDVSTTGGKLLSTFANVVDPMALQSKILSLELISQVLEMSGKAFRTGHKFIYAIQNYLCVSLLKNCMSHDTQVVYLSLKIFLSLVVHFKTSLKSEIEVFVANIFLRVLESPNSAREQKVLVLEALRALCSDPFLITQIFLNYDCDLEADNLYKKIILHMTKLVKSAPSTQQKVEEENAQLRYMGLEILVIVLQAFLKALDLPGQDDEVTNSSEFLDLIGVEQKKNNGQSNGKSELDDSEHATKNVPASSSSALNVVEAYDRKRDREVTFETGVVKFTLSIKEGVNFFIENSFVELDAKELARFFLKNKDILDKTQIGEVLGKEPDSALNKKEQDPEKGGVGFWVRILYHYVDEMDFSGMVFDEAIRLFLSGFRLPGEAQKIDRIMEKFAERYTRQNEDIFPSADTAFILAFSVIMLNTDLHNPNIKPEKKMTIESFIRNNRGIALDGGDLPEEFLKGIFDRIQSKAFSLKEDDIARAKVLEEEASFFTSGFVSAEERKREKFKKERKEMMAASELIFTKKRATKKNVKDMSLVIPPSDVVKPMFDVTWGPLMGTLSQILETTEDDGVIAICLRGFIYSIRISSHSEMSLARETFVNSLAKLTSLGGYIKEVKYKDIECIRTLLNVAILDGEFLEESWGPVLQCISQLAKLHLSASKLASDGEFLNENGVEEPKSDSAFKFFHQATDAEIAKEVEESNGRVVFEAVNGVLIDKVFATSVKLSTRGISHFIEQLIMVSKREIAGEMNLKISQQNGDATGDGPRIFSLQRLVEVADYNMNVRSRIAWTQMWETMAQHFATIGCHSNAIVSMFAIDALRQLSFKFLEKPELNDFNFQRLFLRPFLFIMENQSSRDDIRELVLRCMDNMIRLMNSNLRSGWKIILECLTLSAYDPLEKISTLGLAILQRLLDDHLEALLPQLDESKQEEMSSADLSASERRMRNARVEDFCSLCRASLAFVQVEEMEKKLPVGLSMRALCHVSCYADLIALKKILPPVGIAQTTDSSAFGYTYPDLPTEEESEYMALWRPIMDGLALGISATVRSNSGGVGCLVHRGSIMTLRAILLRHGNVFSISQWKTLLKSVILPSIQCAAESENYPIVEITSENPMVSSFDFLVEALPIPPPIDDEGLLMFSNQNQNSDLELKRTLGPAELLVEASFADLRHGGDGNLSRAYGLTLKKQTSKRVNQDQPFPDSWTATTAFVALGTITDIFGELFVYFGEEGRKTLWPVILAQYQSWILGNYSNTISVENMEIANEADDVSELEDISIAISSSWRPCEAIARIACKEFSRIPLLIANSLSYAKLSKTEAYAWFSIFCASLGDILSMNAAMQSTLKDELVESKLSALGIKRGSNPKSQEEAKHVETPYGKGILVKKRVVHYGESNDDDPLEHLVNHIQLEWGAVLYESKEDSSTGNEEDVLTNLAEAPVQEKSVPVLSPDYLNHYVPALKISCVVAYLLESYLPQSLNALTENIKEIDANNLLTALDKSATVARCACSDADLSHAFQEAIRSSWLDGGVEEVEERIAPFMVGGRSALPQHVGSELFFLTQEAWANKSSIHLLSLLYCNPSQSTDWNSALYAEPRLFSKIHSTTKSFLDSEKLDGLALDANIWKRSSDSYHDIGFYCTAFASVVVSILFTLLKLSRQQFENHLEEIYPLLTSLITVQSDEIRQLVRDLMEQQVLGIMMDRK